MYNVDILVWSQVQSEESEDKEKYSADVAVEGKWRKLEIETFSRIWQKVIFLLGFRKNKGLQIKWMSKNSDLLAFFDMGC